MPVSGLALKQCALFMDAPEALLQRASQLMEIVQLKRREVLLTNDLPFNCRPSTTPWTGARWRSAR
jgi:hypothetical protein